ncbi:MAG: hypothetical protein J6D08_15245 [Lachnospiraceae bacterium]|nr:hypothetical protein [Lachnospiraceae bacterium]
MQKDTELKNFPLYCLKCGQESLIDAKNLQVIECTVGGALLLKSIMSVHFPKIQR